MVAATRPGGGLAGRRLVVATVLGLLGGVASGLALGLAFVPVFVWLIAAAVFLVWTWIAIWSMDPTSTAAHATSEDPRLGVAHTVLLIASVASLAGVVLLLVGTGKSQDLLAAVLGMLSVVASWIMVHTVYTLRYAAAYYGGDSVGGIDFNQRARPGYSDFAYVAFTLGMTYQVSDTDIQDPDIRRMILRHTLLAYVLGAVVLAIAVNLVGNLAS